MQGHTQYDIMRECCADRSGWTDVRHYPATVLCRRMLRLADWAAQDAKRWAACRMAYECPELSARELAVCLSVSHPVILRRIAPVEIATDDDYTAWELGDTVPAWLHGCRAGYDAAHVSATYKRTIALCMFAYANPVQWQVIRCAYTPPTKSQQTLADIFGVTHQTISNYLKIPRLMIAEKEDQND